MPNSGTIQLLTGTCWSEKNSDFQYTIRYGNLDPYHLARGLDWRGMLNRWLIVILFTYKKRRPVVVEMHACVPRRSNK